MKKYCLFLLCCLIGVSAVLGQENEEPQSAAAAPLSPVNAATPDDGDFQTPDVSGTDEADIIPPFQKEIENQKTRNKPYTYQVSEENEPTRRSKRRLLSMHSGLTFSALAANNLASIPDFFKETLFIDLNMLVKKTMASGIHISTLLDMDWFFRFTVLEEHTIQFSSTADMNIWFNIPKSLLELAANGNAKNADGKPIDGTFNGKIHIFADTGVMYQLKKPSYSISARLAYFIPLAYMKDPEAKYTLKADQNGHIAFTFNADTKIYGQFLSNAADPIKLVKKGGLDLSLAGSYQPVDWVNIKAGVNYLPLLVVKLDKGMQKKIFIHAEINDLLGGSRTPNKQNDRFKTDIRQEDKTTHLPPINIMRPCKVQIGADFKPLRNDYFILSPFVAVPVVDNKPFYMDGGLKLESRFAKALGISLATNYIERIWRHELCFLIDSRWFTFTLAGSVASQDFTRTFSTLSGVGIKLGFGMGF